MESKKTMVVIFSNRLLIVGVIGMAFTSGIGF